MSETPPTSMKVLSLELGFMRLGVANPLDLLVMFCSIIKVRNISSVTDFKCLGVEGKEKKERRKINFPFKVFYCRKDLFSTKCEVNFPPNSFPPFPFISSYPNKALALISHTLLKICILSSSKTNSQDTNLIRKGNLQINTTILG